MMYFRLIDKMKYIKENDISDIKEFIGLCI